MGGEKTERGSEELIAWGCAAVVLYREDHTLGISVRT